MPSLLNLLGIPILLLVSLPLAIFAAFTTSLAFTTLLLRVLVVYVELGLALLQAAISPSTSTTQGFSALNLSQSPLREVRVTSRRSSTTGTPPKKTSSFASLAGSGTNRDYEGVGGWRLPGKEEEEDVWQNMNSRLELPATPRRHRRSLTGGSQRVVFSLTPESGRSPGIVRTRTPGTASPEGYFSMPPVAAGFTTAMLQNAAGKGEREGGVGREERSKSSSGSSATSNGSKGEWKGLVKTTEMG